MSDDSKRRRGRPALHQNGGSLLVRAPCEPGDEQQGGWPREQRMDADFVAAVARAIRAGKETAGVLDHPRWYRRETRI
jgi:hypothetical protein